MIDPQIQKKVQTAISHRMAQDRHLLEELRRDVRPLREQVRQIQPRTALGEMMHHLGARRLAGLSHMVPAAGSATPSGRLTSFCRSTRTRPPATVERPDSCRLAPAPAACGQPVAFLYGRSTAGNCRPPPAGVHQGRAQGDNWFIFHLLSAADLNSVRNAHAHFSQDILSTLLNEPIPGHAVFWSSVGGRAYPVSLRVLSLPARPWSRRLQQGTGRVRSEWRGR
jgi:hypothetical protein